MPKRRQAPPRVLETVADLEHDIRLLRRACPLARRMHDLTGVPPLRRRPPGLEGLARIVVGQQVSVASAAAIWQRTAAAVDPFTAETLDRTSDDVLRGAGLSTGKIRTFRALTARIGAGELDIEALTVLPDEAVAAVLTATPGIGPWTSDVFIMFCLGRADAFPAGDLALQVALQRIAGLDRRPTARELQAFAERWRPWRAAAAHLLWAYYKFVEDPQSGMPV